MARETQLGGVDLLECPIISYFIQINEMRLSNQIRALYYLSHARNLRHLIDLQFMPPRRGQQAARQPTRSAPSATAATNIVNNSLSRPQTRAWTQRQRLEDLASIRTAEQPKASEEDQNHPRNQSRKTQLPTRRIASAASPQAQLPTANRCERRAEGQKSPQLRKVTEAQPSQEGATKSKFVADWVEQLDSQAPRPASKSGRPEVLTSETSSTSRGPEVMQTIADSQISSTTTEQSDRTTQSVTGTDLTAKPKGRRGRVTWDKLRQRRIGQEKLNDVRSDDFKTMLTPEVTRIKFRDVGDLQDILRKFLGVCDKARPNQDIYPAIEDLVDQIASWKPQHGLFAVSNREFNKDAALCLQSNEAVLQRTVMASLIDRWHLSQIFTFNCEGQWILPLHSLPTSGPIGIISSPKPDLAMFFRLESLTPDISVAIPESISDCLRPDGGQWRCFPFFFMEAKKAGHDLDPALMANAHNASQALYNMYIWMTLAGESDGFFKSVRVFTVVLNARELALRCYRAELDDAKQIRFQYDDIVAQTSYTRDQACKLIRKVLVEYGENELHDILKSTFQKVVAAFSSGKLKAAGKASAKRPATSVAASLGKKSRPSQGSVDPPLNYTDSFGASDLSMGSSGHEVGISVAP